ncbi:MAG: PIN domain-containing protein [Verrucomicrobiota bacterium]
MNALIDTNVLVDVLVKREPFFVDSSRVLDKAERGEFTAWLCATTITTVFYLVRRHLGAEETKERIEDLTAIFSTAAVNQSVIDSALQSPIADFEDAVLNEAALTAGADCIVTRNEADFRHSSLLIYSPTQFLAALASLAQQQKTKDDQ